jgi:hypothetical protein
MKAPWKGLACLAACIALLAGLAACASSCRTPTGSASAVDVEFIAGDLFRLGGRDVRLTDLPSALRRRGYGPNTSVRVSVKSGFSQNALSAVGGKLAASGFRKVLFVRPRRSAAFIEGAAPGAGGAP